MAGTFFNTGAVEFWGEMVNHSRNFENRSGSNVLLRIMKITKKNTKKWLIHKLKGFLFFSRCDVMVVRDDVCSVRR